MKKKIFSLGLALLMILQTVPAAAFAASETESPPGSPQQEGTYYVLNTEEDLNWFAKEVNTGNTSINAKLGNNIEVSQTHIPIGTKANPFSGIFDGNRKSITLHSGVTFIDTNERYGLFGTLQGTVKNLTVKGTVDLGTKVGNVGGIAGYADVGSTIEHCINEAAVSGKNNVGGISGYNNATIINCGNEGNVSTTGATNAGGIAGGTFSKAQLISGCYNRGNISAKTSIAGGITGACMADITLSDCYNTGNISASSSDRNGYAGGIIGQISYNKNVELQRIYAAGTISGKTTDAICGKSMGKPTASDVFFLDTLKSSVPDVTALSSEQLKTKASDLGAAFAADTAGMNGGYPVLAWQNGGGDTGLSDLKGTISVSGEICCYSTLTAAYHSVPGEENLNLSYQWCRNGVPVENAAEAQYKVTEEDLASDLSVSVSVDGYNRLTSDTMHVPDLVAVSTEPAEAQITISNGDKVYQSITGQPGIYSLPAGAYSYTVTMGEGSEYVDEKGTFQVPGKELLEVVLKEKLYETDFAVKPDEAENAEITVKDSQGRLCMPEKGSGKYQLKKGTYSLTAELFGFETVHKNFDVTAAGIVEIQMKKLPAYDIVFKTKNFSQEQSKKLHLTVKTGGKTVYTGNRMSLSLPEGDYQYTVSCGGYRSEIGTFKVEKKNTLVEFSMTRDTGWDGRTMTEPSRDAGGVYLICNAAELMWFNRHAKMDDSAKLMADITVNQDMRLDENQLHVWNPIGNYAGYSGSRPYEGTFDGDGHSITGLYIPGSDAKNAAFCGYLGEGGVIRNLTIDGVVKNERSRNQYVAGIAGTCKGLIAGCVNLAEISGGSYVGGIVGSADKTCRIENSVNQGSVTASAERAGGICGVLYAEGSQAVSGCCNFGKVQAKGFAGGITGDFYSGAGIVNTYNRGEVISQGISGGIAGNFRSGTMNHVYHAGTVKGAQNGTGSIAGRLEWAGGSRTFDQVFWLEGSAESEIGNTGGYSISGQAQKMSEEELKSVDLGNAYTEDRPPYINDGYPVLKWQAGEVFEPEKPESRPDAWDGKETSQPQQKDGIYQIGNAAELKWFADQINSGKIELKAVLTADIDLNHQEFSSIGGSAENHAFRGTFDGAYKKIKGFYQDASESGYGLFAVNAGTVKNFTISGKADARDVYGVVAGKNSGVIEGCTNEVSVNGGNQIGGIVGVNLKNGEVRRCRNKADIEGARMVGGIAGRNNTDALIEECANSGTVLSVKEFCGGICAENEGNLLSCYNKGLIVCMSDILRAYAGGVAGHNAGYTSDIYNTGNVVSAGGYAGGVLGISLSLIHI